MMTTKGKIWLTLGLAFMAFSGTLTIYSQEHMLRGIWGHGSERSGGDTLGSARSSGSVDRKFAALQRSALRVSEKAPYEVADGVEFVGAQARREGDNLSFVSRFQITDPDVARFGPSQLAMVKRIARAKLLQSTCGDDDLIGYLNHDVALGFEYIDKNDKPLMEFNLTKSDCEAFAQQEKGDAPSSSPDSKPTRRERLRGKNGDLLTIEEAPPRFAAAL